MTEERWQRIADQIDMGDPLKDIEFGPEQIEYELFAYCRELRARLAGWTNIGHDPTGKLVGLPPNAEWPGDYKEIP